MKLHVNIFYILWQSWIKKTPLNKAVVAIKVSNDNTQYACDDAVNETHVGTGLIGTHTLISPN